MITTTFRRHYWVAVVAAFVAVLGLLNYHWADIGLGTGWQQFVNATAFAGLVLQLFLAHLNPDMEAEETDENRLSVTAIVTCYNEDPGVFRKLLDSLAQQTRRPDRLIIVDDGSPSTECFDLYAQWAREVPEEQAFSARMIRQKNTGKRRAQYRGFLQADDADVFWTVDSDTILDPKALENGLKPFLKHPEVQSVAGLLLGLNVRQNLLTRLIDLGFVTSFLNGRASWSRLHSVSVNCGGHALYRADTVRKHLDEYVGQEVMGKPVASGDDRILTNLCLLEGWAVFQRSSVGYTLHPINLKHLNSQRIRWWRSFFWGGEWLLRRVSPRRTIWWLIAGQFHDFVLFTFMLLVVAPYVFIVSPFVHQDIPWQMFLYLAGIGYLRTMRYMSLRRSDVSFWQQLGIWLMSPLAVLLNVYLCTCLQYVGLATVRTTKWSTRDKVEVRLEESAA